jgi:hypothetical protein
MPIVRLENLKREGTVKICIKEVGFEEMGRIHLAQNSISDRFL